MANTSRKTVPTPSNLGNAKFSPPASGLNESGVPAAIKLKSKKIVNLRLAKG